ncbi:LacI family DNA-binding transcriptional regulator [Natronohydrobacter thiooxidans]|uniref:LacI family DNA-binding transcriptional regulator n=1 Tax=Natronohydrobacter thiooxidans TaxID=87172 RepID=UPI001587D3FC|nr:LacI family DNA-binding transcriptional regulator [Natronohydrobacter thiooxidans]
MSEQKIRNMEEFAAVSGISRPTVSKYFQDPESVRASTRQRIETALERYDFRPNIFAMNQNRKLTKIVGVVVPYLADPFFAEIARKIERRCIDAGFWPILFSAHGEQRLENAILDSLRVLKPAGVLMAPLGRVSDRAAVERFCADVPTVLFDSNIEGVGKVFVGSDNTDFVTQSVDYLVRTGTAPVFFEMRYPANPNANKRRLAYIANMKRLGLEPHVVKIEGEGWDFERIGYEGGLKAIREKALPTNTILCSNDRLAVGFLTACFEAGLSVGYGAEHAMRVMSHDDHPVSRFTCPPLTTVAHDYDSVSNKAVEVLFHMLEEGTMPEAREEFLYPTKLILRKSA